MRRVAVLGPALLAVYATDPIIVSQPLTFYL